MAFEHKSAWVDLVVALLAYAAYLLVVLRADGPLVDAAYAVPMLCTIGAAIVVTIVVRIGVAIVRRDAATDERDRQIGRFGDHVGQSFLAIGGVSAIALAMLEADPFWIANAVYLCFVLSAALTAVAKIAAYQRGLHAW